MIQYRNIWKHGIVSQSLISLLPSMLITLVLILSETGTRCGYASHAMCKGDKEEVQTYPLSDKVFPYDLHPSFSNRLSIAGDANVFKMLETF